MFFNFYDINYLFGVFHLIFFFKKPLRILLHLAWPPLQKVPGSATVEEDGFVWYLTCFYGWPEASQKAKSWALLSHFSSFVDGPWLCIGDFNAILHSAEKLSHWPPSYKHMDEFEEVLEQCSLSDLGFLGYPYTWNNK